MPKVKLPVYREVDGQRVRIPGDVQDPKRRYGQVENMQTGESYLREYTDEEERRADAQAAAEEAERPQREAETKRHEEEAARFRESLRYESRIVAFLDVLGWADAVDESVDSVDLTQQLGIAMQGLAAEVDRVSWQREQVLPGGWPGDPMMTHFSDSLLISFSTERFSKNNMEMMLTAVILRLMFHGFVIRGAVSYGPMIHREAMAYGPAMIEAYKLEKNEAIMPRVILDNHLAKEWGVSEPVKNRDGSIHGYLKYWRLDEDGWYFFDHFSNPYGVPLSLLGLESQERRSTFQRYMNKWRELIIRRLDENRVRSHVFRKYVWLARHFNRACTENPSGQVETISLPGD